MSANQRTMRPRVLGWLFIVAFISGWGVVIGLSVDRGQGLEAIERIWPVVVLLLGFNALLAWIGLWPQAGSLAPSAKRSIVALTSTSGTAATMTLLLRDQGTAFALATGVTVAVGLAGFALVSDWLTTWAGSRRD